ncbi:MAG TPA: uracil-DNA glycosylase [Solibacterales bacterium]|nr:uracil-DNA glycosylase [Bryobacterales bacterium]
MHSENCNPGTLQVLQARIVACRQCPRLIAHCSHMAQVKRRAYRDWEYWGRPVPSFGSDRAKLLIVGLAPAAHGANRTGRVFTGDRSGDLLYRVLHRTGFATQAESRSANDGLQLIDARITAVAHCAPPDNKPLPEEIRNCRHWLKHEIALLGDLQVVVALGRIGFDGYLAALLELGRIQRRAGIEFGHNLLHDLGPRNPALICSYHPSQQNTSTGRLTEAMLMDVFESARGRIASNR